MKEKLLKLVEACINSNEDGLPLIFTNTYYKQLTSIVGVKFRGNSVGGKSGYNVPLRKYEIEEPKFDIDIRFDKQPPLCIKSIVKGNNGNQVITKTTVIGTRKWWITNIKVKTEFEVTIGAKEYHYELRCGSFAYIIDDETVNRFYDMINKKRKDKELKYETDELNERFNKFNITD